MPPKYNFIASKVSGYVKWFNEKEGCGRIIVDPYGEVFVHHSRIKSPNNPKGNNYLKASQNVVCNIIRGPKGLMSDDVRLVPHRNPRSSSVSSKERQRHVSTASSVTEPDTQEMAIPDMSEIDVIEKDLRGEVTEYDHQRRYGFVLIRQYGNVHCHASSILFSGIKASDQCLQPTQIVKCDVGRDTRGMLFAVNIHVISGATKQVEREPVSDVPSKASSGEGRNQKVEEKAGHTEGKPAGIIAHDLLGEVIRYDTKKKFGFIRIQGYDSVYVHRNGLMKVNELKSQQIVKCDITHGPKTLMALNVRIVGDISDSPTTSTAAPPSLMGVHAAKLPPAKPKPKPQPPMQLASAPPPPMNPMYPYPSQQQVPPAFSPPMGSGYSYPSPPFIPVIPQPALPPYLTEMPPPYQANKPPDLSGLHISDPVQKVEKKEKNKRPKKKKEVQPDDGDKMKQSVLSKLTCEICEDPLDDPVTAPCEHLFCRECINEWLAVNPSCPVDGKAISRKSLKQAPLKIRELADMKLKS